MKPQCKELIALGIVLAGSALILGYVFWVSSSIGVM